MGDGYRWVMRAGGRWAGVRGVLRRVHRVHVLERPLRHEPVREDPRGVHVEARLVGLLERVLRVELPDAGAAASGDAVWRGQLHDHAALLPGHRVLCLCVMECGLVRDVLHVQDVLQQNDRRNIIMAVHVH